MNTDNKARIIAIVGTVLIAALTCVVLNVSHLSAIVHDLIQPDRGEIVLLDEEYVEVFTPPTTPNQGLDNSTPHNDVDIVQPSQPTPVSGTDLSNSGPVADPTPVVTAKQESTVKQTTDKPKNPGSSAEDKQKKEQEEIKRQATNEVTNAFNKSSGKNNTSTSTTQDQGRSGSTSVDPNQQGTTGTGTGQVGGGWIIPKYAAVRSTVTGSVKLIVKIDAQGNVISVTPNGGTPPAATNSALQQAIIKEVRSHRFSRSNYDNAEPATAYVTYTFK